MILATGSNSAFMHLVIGCGTRNDASMATDSELIQIAIATSAKAGIQSSSNDAGSVTAMTIADQIRAAQFVASQSAARKPHFGMRMSKCIPPGGG